MKKIIATAAMATVIGLTGIYTATSNMGPGWMHGPGDCGSGMHMSMAGMDDATKTKFKEFLKDTQDTRRAIAVKRAEKFALMGTDNPDPKKLGEIAGELFDLRNTMQTKAEAAGLSEIMGRGQGWGGCDRQGPPNRPYGMMPGQGPGQSSGNPGRPCPNSR